MASLIEERGKVQETESEKKEKWLQTAKWIYWTLTLFFTVTMIAAGIAYLLGVKEPVEGITKLGYPLYVMKILGVAKILGGIAILQNRFQTLKEWAYAGYTFNLIGASSSHLFVGNGLGDVLTPLIILCVVQISYRQWKTGWM
ncbi:DoxX-like family protein [Leptospira tipperaryensis]|uniref:DoxX-like family protein n=1 Tax=Leptospira tipperaryensis TaxID=2564040 RepID=A0A1D7UW65_9LEPT|nr:DoxX family protein [Leptospira tipperaryensis]AOP33803.1 DoxX-like family protein [Leptospira tipperaryensis]